MRGWDGSGSGVEGIGKLFVVKIIFEKVISCLFINLFI